MNVLNNRNIDKVIVLGSGMSIMQLTEEEKLHINSCKVVIAVNKFMAFYQMSGLYPTHVYFADKLGNSTEFFRYLLSVCRNDKLENLTFITNKYNAQIGIAEKSLKPVVRAFTMVHVYKCWSLFKKLFRKKNFSEIDYYRLKLDSFYMLFPEKSKIIGIETAHYLSGGTWSDSFRDPLFHFRGSLTSVLNVCSIVAPGIDIYLVGNDFNGARYFFEDELDNLSFEWKDYTYDLVKKEGKHFSFQEVEGKKMEDVFPYIIESLKKKGNNLFCINKDSLLVTTAGVAYKKLI